MKHFITYGNEKFTESKRRICKEAEECGWFDSITIYEPKDLEKEFQNKYKDVLKLPRGGGYWIWRPYILLKKLNEMNENDYLIYVDAGCTINKKGQQRFYEYLKLLDDSDEGIISFQMPHKEKYYTTKEIFNYFNVLHNPNITNTSQIIGGVLLMKKNNKLMEKIHLFYQVIENNKLLFTDFYNKNQEPYFIDNRHDQSIFSVIRKLGNPILLKDETWFHFGDEKSLHYPFWATRKRR